MLQKYWRLFYCYLCKDGNIKLIFSTRVYLFFSMLILGIGFGIVFHQIVMPYFGSQLFHCITSGIVFGIINFFAASIIYTKYNLLKQSNKILQLDVNIDSLTGLLNRRAFNIDCDTFQDKDDYAVIFIDIDNFREYNNIFGHQIADAVLKKVSQAIKNNVRLGDQVYRYGGEEIVVILNQCDKNNALKIADKIKLTLGQLDYSPYSVVTVSMGVSSYPEDGKDLYAIIKASDEALIDAKGQGKNCIVSYNGFKL